jgi:phosphoglycolate phosphatase-like HAD superfamily hydrolase
MQEDMASRLRTARGVLFDLHHTITRHERSNLNWATRDVARNVGLDIDHCTEEQLRRAIAKAEDWMREYHTAQAVDLHWGTEPEDWIEINRVMFTELGFQDIEDSVLIELETRWKKRVNSPEFETLHEDTMHTLSELHRRKYRIGICTRRFDDPTPLLNHWGIADTISTLHWTGVHGYAKPSPYTLLKSAEDLELNPRLCVFVGNYVDADVTAAMRAEMIPVLLTWANPEEGQKAPAEALVLESPSELLQLLPGAFTADPR